MEDVLLTVLNSISIFLGAVYAYVLLLTFLGPEYLGRDMSVMHDEDMEEAAGHDAVEKVAYGAEKRQHSTAESDVIGRV